MISGKKMEITLDRVQGMLMGAFLGDALGAPHEFTCNKNTKYTGILEHQGFHISRFQGRRELMVGQVTDDSEMSLALLRTLIIDGKYVKENVISSYLDWANSGGWMIGVNTSALLRGVKTIKGYEKRLEKIYQLPIAERSQSNGTLMRASPLALLFDNNAVVEDALLTNPNPVNVDCNLVYVNSLRLALKGFDGKHIFETAKKIAQTKEVLSVLEQVEKGEIRDISKNKGWCLNALWCAMVAITRFNNYSEAMNWIITSQKCTDTDTNACIAGALLGASLGFRKMEEEDQTAHNISVIVTTTENSPTPRPLKYGISDFYELSQEAYLLTQN